MDLRVASLTSFSFHNLTPSSTTMATTKTNKDRDLSSLSNSHEVRVTHLDWDVKVDFESSTLSAKATYTIDRVDAKAGILCLDTSCLVIRSVTDQNGKELSFKIHALNKAKAYLGRKLEIKLLTDEIDQVTIDYSTTPECSALQWLPPAQTAGKVHPYLFTQCQAIHARSLVPCQDLPGNKMTYEAVVQVPAWAVCVMSAVLRHETTKNEDSDEPCKVFKWEQKVPISSYLLAMAVGDLAKKDISNRCAIWSEPLMVEAAAYEFGQTEDFLQMAESLAGSPYAWGRYDLLCLPPSFPYGGMENPNLVFVTPTLLARDRSLADVIAHEIAHCWTGNLVTNATWDHFWLNEGWTMWFQRKIMARIHDNPAILGLDAIGGYQDLRESIEGGTIPEKFTKLVLPIGDNDPDDAYSRVAYEKGFNLLYALEQRVGSEAFETFFKAYVAKFSNKTVTSDEFRDYFLQYFKGNAAAESVDWESWYHAPGMPPETPEFDRSLAEEAEHLAECWLAVDRDGSELPTEQDLKSWSTGQIVCFLNKVMEETKKPKPATATAAITDTDTDKETTTDKVGLPLKTSTVNSMDKAYGFASSQNSEILFRYCMLALDAEDQSMIYVILHFMTSQGRMKYVRPLYRALFASEMGKDIAISVFLSNKDFYHPIGAKMIASDLMIDKKKDSAFSSFLASLPKPTMGVLAGVAAIAAVAVGFALLRRKP
jgi:leukotriene-A4 hydrolase